MKSCRNYKVRINACSALTIPESRDTYGSPHTFSLILDSTCHCLTDVANAGSRGSSGINPSSCPVESAAAAASDFTNYKYAVNLQHGLSCLLLRLITLVRRADLLCIVTSPASSGGSYTSSGGGKYNEAVSAAQSHLAEIKSAESLTDEESAAVERLEGATDLFRGKSDYKTLTLVLSVINSKPNQTANKSLL